ncbi:MAG: 16S rRNA (cytosine(1402)-N(4))-methyltransferase RsmH [Vulcanimicrobiaceae bacterium]
MLLAEALAGLAVAPGGLYLDATFGRGGHSRAIVAAGGRVLALDRDPQALVPDDLAAAVTLVHADFSELGRVLAAQAIASVDGVLFDLGVSSPQLDDAARGFSFAHDGPLDMRMSGEGPTAYDLLARASERELAEIFFSYGEEPRARRVARAIVAARSAGRLPERTVAFAALVAGALQVRGRRERNHPATRIFQALRIAVNDELDALERGLDAASERTRPGGRIVAISFHSLEDRIVKHRFRDDLRLRPIVRRPLLASEAERAANPRARSAKLRIAERSA